MTVRLDDVATGRAATRHLLDLGHRVIGDVTGVPDLVSSWSPPVERARGYVRALEEAGVVVQPDLEVNGDFDVAGGRESTAELLRRRPDVTAVFAASDEMAMGRSSRRATWAAGAGGCPSWAWTGTTSASWSA